MIGLFTRRFMCAVLDGRIENARVIQDKLVGRNRLDGSLYYDLVFMYYGVLYQTIYGTSTDELDYELDYAFDETVECAEVVEVIGTDNVPKYEPVLGL